MLHNQCILKKSRRTGVRDRNLQFRLLTTFKLQFDHHYFLINIALYFVLPFRHNLCHIRKSTVALKDELSIKWTNGNQGVIFKILIADWRGQNYH